MVEAKAEADGVVDTLTVELVTKIDDLALSQVNGVRLAVPVGLGRVGLREVVLRLAGLRNGGHAAEGEEQPDYTELDFIVREKLLRTTLAKFCARHEISTENVLEIEFIKSAPRPSARDNDGLSLDSDDWVSSLLGLTHANRLLVGFCEGPLRVASADARSESRELVVKDVQGGITDICRGPKALVGVSRETGSIELRAESSLQLIARSESTPNATTSAQSLDLVGSDTLAVGYENGSIALYHAPHLEPPEPVSKKRKSRSAQSLLVNGTLSGHSDCITQVRGWEEGIFTSSWDSTVRSWSVEAQVMLRAIPTGKGATSFVLAPSQSTPTTVLGGLVDGNLRVLDCREAASTPNLQGIPGAHRGWVSAVEWSPTRPNVVASAGHDGFVKGWDLRSPKDPLMNVAESHGPNSKVQALAWSRDKDQSMLLVSGGSDGKIRGYTFP